MRILYFGAYNRSYSRNRILIRGLELAGAKVIECHDDSPLPLRLFRLFKKHWAIRKQYDLMIVGFAGQGMSFFAKLITRKPVILDAFYSVYNTTIEDRKLHGKFSLTAIKSYLLDWLSSRIVDAVLLDTNEHIKYYERTFKVNPKKFIRVLIGADDSIFKLTSSTFYQRSGLRSTFLTVGFQGTYVPLQGAEYIVRAAKELESESNIQFIFFGIGQDYKKTRALAEELQLKNITFVAERVPPEKVAEWVGSMDISLGIFGSSTKAAMVIPNKVYESIAMRKATITMDSPAIREVFSESELLLVPPHNPHAIAEAIRKLTANNQLRESLAEAGYKKYLESGAPKKIGETLINELHRRYSS